MREQFEKLPRIAGILAETGVYYSHVNDRYTSNYENGHESYLCGFMNGAWYAYQEQQKKIDEPSRELVSGSKNMLTEKDYAKYDCEQCRGDARAMRTYMILCPDCGNKRCPQAENHRYKCTKSNEVGQIGELK